MAADREWMKTVSDVYDLILHETDKIVDDTSLEKFLDIINEDLKRRDLLLHPLTIQFLDKMSSCLNANAIAFSLRLTGNICAINDEYFQALVKNKIFSKNSPFHGLFRDKSFLWEEEPCVRDSYFKCATNILKCNGSLQLIKELECVKEAITCLVDRSIFVEESSRKFIAKYMIEINVLNENTHEHWMEDQDSGLTCEQLTCILCLSSHLRSLLRASPCGLSRTISVQVSITQLLLTLMETDAVIGQNIISEQAFMPCCFQLLYSGNKNENRKVIDVMLTFLNNTSKWNIDWNLLLNVENCLEHLLEVVLNLNQRSFTLFALQMTQSLFKINCPSDMQQEWFSTLFAIITSPLHYSLHKNETSSPDFDQTNDATQQLLSLETTNDDTYKILDQVFFKKLKKGTMLSSTIISYSIMLTTNVVQIFADTEVCEMPRLFDLIRSWFEDILTLFHTKVNKQSEYENHSLRQCVKAVIVLVQNRFLEQDGTSSLDCVQLSCLLSKILQNNSDSQLLTECLKCFQLLFNNTDLLLLHHDKKTEDDFSLKDVFQCCFNHHCWDLRDSILGLIKSSISTLTSEKLKVFSEFLVTNGFLIQIWNMKDDIESFVRTSVIQLLAKLPHHEDLWRNLLRDLHLTQEEMIIEKFQLFIEDESAFCRRAIIKLLIEWLNLGILSTFLPAHNESRTLDSRLSNILNKASDDFDWEVKICVLNFWEHVYTKYPRKVTENESLKDCLLKSIKNGLVDCDKPVKQRSVELMKKFQDGGFFEDLQATFCEDLMKESITFDNTTEEASYFLKDIILSATNNHDNLLDCY